MRRTIGDAIALIPRSHRKRWLALIGVAFVSCCFEAMAAVLVYAVLRIATQEGSELTVPILGDLTQRFPDSSPDGVFVTLTVAVAGFFVVRGAVSLIQTYVQNRMAQSTGADLSVRLLAGYLQMPYTWHLRHNSTEMMRNAFNSVLQVSAYVLLPLVALISDGLMVGAIALVLLVKAPMATLLASGILGALVFVVLRVVRPRAVAAGSDNENMTQQSLQVI